MSQIFGLSFCISILKVLWTQILFHSLDFSHFRSTFLRVLKFLQIKDGRPNIWGEPILQHVLIIQSPFSYFNLRSSMDPNSSSFIRFQCFLHDSEVLFPESWNFQKSKRGNLISGGNQFCQMSELFAPSCCTSILKVLWTQIFRHSLDFSHFCMNQEYFSQSLETSRNQRGET